MKRKKHRIEPEVVWIREEKQLTLEGEPVLEYSVSRPEVHNGGLGGRWISRYYCRLVQSWQQRWHTRVYWLACLELVRCREEGRLFTEWRGMLKGEVTFLQDGLLSLKLEGEEIRNPGRPCRVCWGDSWEVWEGRPCLPRELPGLGKGWKKKARKEILEQGRARRVAGEFFPDSNWEEKMGRKLPLSGVWLTQEGVKGAFPQGVLAPPAEGTPVFFISRGNTGEPCTEISGKAGDTGASSGRM